MTDFSPSTARSFPSLPCSQKAEAAAAKQHTGPILPVSNVPAAVPFVELTADLKKNKAFTPLRQEWVNAKYFGVRAKRAKEAAEKAASAKPAAAEE